MLSMSRLAFFLVFLLLIASPARGIELGMPIDCEYGTDCFIQNYVDVDLTGWREDYTCGPLTYDGHTGTDFRVPWEDYKAGVDVLAAADGVVYKIRGGIEDRDARGREAEVSIIGLGNAVLISHPEGFLTSYGHLKKGSVRVKEGDRVKRGQILGQVGLSGLTHFSHVHFGVKQYGHVLCPFKGVENPPECGIGPNPLWDVELPYIPSGLLQAGFVDTLPSLPGIVRQKRLLTMEPRAEILGYAVTVFGVRKGDESRMRILAPSGALFSEREESIDRNQAQHLFLVGRKLLDKPGWPVGTYRGEFRLVRDGKVVLMADRTVRVR